MFNNLVGTFLHIPQHCLETTVDILQKWNHQKLWAMGTTELLDSIKLKER